LTDCSWPRTVTNPTTTTRPEDGQPSQVIDANGLRVTTQYDAFGFATRVQYRGVTDSEYLAPDKLMSLSWCTGCFAQGRTRVAVVFQRLQSLYTTKDMPHRSEREHEAIVEAICARSERRSQGDARASGFGDPDLFAHAAVG